MSILCVDGFESSHNLTYKSVPSLKNKPKFVDKSARVGDVLNPNSSSYQTPSKLILTSSLP